MNFFTWSNLKIDDKEEKKSNNNNQKNSSSSINNLILKIMHNYIRVVMDYNNNLQFKQLDPSRMSNLLVYANNRVATFFYEAASNLYLLNDLVCPYALVTGIDEKTQVNLTSPSFAQTNTVCRCLSSFSGALVGMDLAQNPVLFLEGMIFKPESTLTSFKLTEMWGDGHIDNNFNQQAQIIGRLLRIILLDRLLLAILGFNLCQRMLTNHFLSISLKNYLKFELNQQEKEVENIKKEFRNEIKAEPDLAIAKIHNKILEKLLRMQKITKKQIILPLIDR